MKITWTPQMDNYLRRNMGRTALSDMARVLTEFVCSSVITKVVVHPEDVTARAIALGISAAGMPQNTALEVKALNALGSAKLKSLRLASEPQVQSIFALLTQTDPERLAQAMQLVELERYRRGDRKDGKKVKR